MTASTIPPSNKPASQNQGQSQQPKNRLHTDSKSLEPDIKSEQLAVLDARWFWVGALPECPIWTPTFAGVSFAKMSERVVNKDGQTFRYPLVGCLANLNRTQVDAVISSIRRTVIRFSKPGDGRGPGVGGDAVELKTQHRNGALIKIPTEQELKERRDAGMPAESYSTSPLDEPVARYVFMLPCVDQNNPARGTHYPEPVSVTGIDWPA